MGDRGKMIFSANRFPINSTVQAGLLFGGCVHPFAVPPVVHSHSNKNNLGLRCTGCGSYWWPNCSWRGKDSWTCALCGMESVLKDGIRPSASELREFTLMYQDDEVGDVVFFFILDAGFVAEGDAFVDSSLLAILSAVQLDTLPPNVRFGLAIALFDSMTLLEFTPEYFSATTVRLNEFDAFCVSLKECTNPMQATTTDRVLFGQALSSIKSIIRSQARVEQNRRVALGRTIQAVLLFLDESISGAHVFAFSETCGLSSVCRQALLEAQTCQNGFDVITTAGKEVDVALQELCKACGGRVISASMEEVVSSFSARCSMPFVFRGMIKARTCPELWVGKSREASFATTPTTSSTRTSGWWLINLLQRVFSLIQFNKGDFSAPEANRNRDLSFLGFGRCLHAEGVWLVSSCSNPEKFSLGFELDFIDALGLDAFSYPRALAVQVASTFVTLTGKRMTRVETRSCEGADTPGRNALEVWAKADFLTLVYLLVRILHFVPGYADDLPNTVMDWAARALAIRGLTVELFEKKLAKLLFGVIQISPPTRTFSMTDASPLELERYLWPKLFRVDLPHALLPLKRSSLMAKCSYVLDCFSDIFVVLGTDDEEAKRAIGFGERIMTQNADSRLWRLQREHLETLSLPAASSSAFAKSDQDKAKELFSSFMYEEGTYFEDFVLQVRERAKFVAL